MANVILKDKNGTGQTYNGVNKVALKDTSDNNVIFANVSGVTANQNEVASDKYYVNSSGDLVQGGAEKTYFAAVTPTKQQQTINAAGKLAMTNIIVNAIPNSENIVPENIKKDVVIAGTTGTYEGSGGGISGGYNVKLVVDNVDWAIVSIEAGEAITHFPEPSKTGYSFMGWSTTVGGAVNITLPYTPTGDITIYSVFSQVWSCTVTGLGNSVAGSVSFSHQGTMPTFEQVTFNGDSMIKIPTMYRKVNTVSSNQITSYTIANAKVDDSYIPYSCFVDEGGNLLDYVLIGRFMSNSSSTCVSKGTTGQTSGRVNQTISTGRTNARARGTGYQLYDWQMQKLWQDLITCKMNTININTGLGITTDALGFEWENSGSWIDGIGRTSGFKWAASLYPSTYINSPTGNSTGYHEMAYNAPSSDGEIMKLGYDENYPFVNFPNTVTTDGSYLTYYCDGYWRSSSSAPVRSSVGYASANFGAFYCNTYDPWSDSNGVRLCYRPL